MADTVVLYNGDGTTTQFTYPFDSLSETYVVSTVYNATTSDDVSGNYVISLDYDTSTVTISPAPLASEQVEIKRVTSAEDDVYAFAAGSVIRPQDIEFALKSTRDIAEEARDQAAEGPQGPQGPAGPAGPAGDTGPQGDTGATGPQGATGAQGPQGDSAYDIAVAEGFVGTQSEWIASVEGVQGPAGPTGATGPAGPTGAQGPQGDSAYQSALNTGFSGTEAEWIASVQGVEGPAGPAGPQGPQGPQGATGPTGPTGPQGNVGPEGPAGATGPQGPQGPEGPSGATSLAGLTDVSATAPTDSQVLAWNNTGSTWEPQTVSGGGGAGGFPSGTKMLFQQTAAPTGWTKETTHNNKALRVVSGTASSGGSVDFETAFSASRTVSGSVADHTLILSEIPIHNHGAGTLEADSHSHSISGGSYNVSRFDGDFGGDRSNNVDREAPIESDFTQFTITVPNSTGDSGALGVSGSTADAGGGGSHNHGWSGSVNLDVQYVDLIIATKD